VTGFHIHNRNSSLCLAARAGVGERPVVQTTCDNPSQIWNDQYWELVNVNQDQHRYRIRSTLLNLCIATRGSGETRAVATTCGSGSDWPDQIWTISYDPAFNADKYTNNNSGLCLVARGRGESQAVQSDCGQFPDQRWY
jgi:hypothetical protein